MTIESALRATRERLAQAEAAAGREAGSVRLLAVSKTFPAEAVREAAAAGQQCFGENYVQELAAKAVELAELGLEWHFIGPLQSNKTRPVAECAHWVHSIDRLKIAERLSAQRPQNMPDLQVCLQSECLGEASKSGVSPAEIPALAAAVAALPRLRLRGLMCAFPRPPTTCRACANNWPCCRSCARSWPNRAWRWTPCRWACPPTWSWRWPVARPWCAWAPPFWWPHAASPCLTFTHRNSLSRCTSLSSAAAMATAIIAGLTKARGCQISVVEPNADKRAQLAQQFGVTTQEQLPVYFGSGQIVVLAVKPQQLREVCGGLASRLDGALVLSIAAAWACQRCRAGWMATSALCASCPTPRR